MVDDAETLCARLDKLDRLVKLAQLNQSGDDRTRMERSIQLVIRALQLVAQSRQQIGNVECQRGFRQVSRQILSGGTDQPWRAVSSSGDGEHIAQGGDPLDIDCPSPGCGHVLLASGGRSEEVAHLVMSPAEAGGAGVGLEACVCYRMTGSSFFCVHPPACCTDGWDGVGREACSVPLGSRRHAAQIQCRPSPPYSAAEATGDELVRI